MNVEKILEEICKEFSEEKVAEKLDDEIFSGNWIDKGWENDGFESEYEWYMEFGRGEAEDVVVGEMIKWWEEKYNSGESLGDEIRSEVFSGVQEVYNFLL